MTTRRLTCGFVSRLDKRSMLSGIAWGTEPQRRSLAWGRALFIGLLASFILLSSAFSSFAWKNSEMNLKLYAHNQIRDWDEFICFIDLIEKESSWNHKSRNGSHYGLAQMRNHNVRTLTPRQQVRWHMRYLDHRYNGSACKALKHMNKKGWH